MTEPARPTCPACGVLNDADAIFCGKCGRPLDAPAGVGRPAARDQEPWTQDIPTNPGFSDPSLAERRAGRVDEPAPSTLSGPTREDVPISKSTLRGGMPRSPSRQAPANAQNPTLMSETPLRNPEASGLGNSPPRHESAAAKPDFGGPTLLDEPSLATLQRQVEEARAREAERGASPEPPPEETAPQGTFAPTARDGGAPQPDAGPRGSTPPLSDEARALLERFGEGGAGASAARETAEAASAPVAASEGRADDPTTLRGAPAVKAPAGRPSGAEPPAKPKSAAADLAVKDGARTMLGMPAAGLPVGRSRGGAPEADAPATAPPAHSKKDPVEVAPVRELAPPPDISGGTMLGLPAAPAAPKNEPASGSSGPVVDEGGMTMLGLPSPAKRGSSRPTDAAPAPGADAPERPARVEATPPSHQEKERLDETPSTRGRGVVIGLVVVALLLAVASAVAAALWLGGDPYEISTEVVVGGDRARVTLDVSPAPEGGRVRFVDQEQPLVDGRATFEVRSTDLDVGENELPVEVIDGEGGRTRAVIAFNLSYRASADLSGLQKQPPSYAVRFQVMKGATLAVAGRPVKLDPAGVYVHSVPLDEALAGAVDAGDAVVHKVPFTVTRPGQPPQSESIDTAIPRTTLRVTAPAADEVVAADSIVCAGITDEAATVTVNGVNVAVNQGRFTHTVSLPSVGVHPIEVVAVTAGKVPRTQRLEVRRTESLEPLVAAFAKTIDARLTYPVVARDPAAARGRPVGFHGQVVAVESAAGQVLLQVLVDRGCPSEQRCSIHVTAPGSTSVERFAMVTVYGTVSGQWEGRTQGGQPLVMPAIRARFVVVDGRRSRSR